MGESWLGLWKKEVDRVSDEVLEDDMKLADRIRKHVLDKKIEPAREMGRSTVVVFAGEIHKEMDLENRMPAVCGALDTEKFEDYARVRLVERSGPKYGSTAKWIFELNYPRMG